MGGRVRAYLGMSLDGRIAGPQDQLDWLDAERPRRLPDPVEPTGTIPLAYEDLMADVGAMLWGRRTLDVVAGFDQWSHGDVPVLVATSRPLDPPAPTVRAVAGPVDRLVAEALAVADGGDVYVDGGRLVCSVLAAGLLDELTITILPTVRGEGIGLFDGLAGPQDLDLVRVAVQDGAMAQLTYAPHGPER